ncbi:nucleolin-like [Cynara cardunculus var. scolymus]|uniref:nucleolin-like n=1 Tax=Cynara cardunculus var. scolymus TaxID=59895 RepID=UPI000D62A23D|nr:nucleolin-like [Cynara cardunculus var. scolymus]
MALQNRTVDHVFGYCSKSIDKKEATESGAASLNVVVAAEPAVLVTEAEADAHPEAEADAHPEAEVADENPTYFEALIVENVDAVRAGTEAHDEELPITSVANASDMEDDDEDGGEDLDDDDDDDDDEFTIHYQRPDDATKGVALKDSTSQGEQGEKEKEI